LGTFFGKVHYWRTHFYRAGGGYYPLDIELGLTGDGFSFAPGCGKRIPIITDGDNDLERYIGEFFPEAEHTIDVYHVVEYLWAAGECLYCERSTELREWVESQKSTLYDGRVADVIAELDRHQPWKGRYIM